MGFYLGVNGVVRGLSKWVLSRVLSSPKKGSEGFYMNKKIVRLSGFTRVGTRLKSILRRVLNGLKYCAPIRFYMGVKQVLKRTLKGFIWVLCGT